MLSFDVPHSLGLGPALERLARAAETRAEGRMTVTWDVSPPAVPLSDGAEPTAPVTGAVAGKSPLGDVRARFAVHSDRVAVEVVERPRFVPDGLLRGAVEDELRRVLG